MRVALFGVFALLACGPDAGRQPKGDEAERYAAAVCDAVATCGCYDHYGGVDSCQNELADRFSAFVDLGFDLSSDCFDEVVEGESLHDCTLVETSPEQWSCTVLRGPRQLGDSCSDYNLEVPPFTVNECQEGLYCLDGVCAHEGSIGPARDDGDACFADQATSCHDATLYCSADGVCRPRPLEGEACDSPFACVQDWQPDGTSLYCQGVLTNGVGVCTRKSLVGAPCDPVDWNPCVESEDPATLRASCDPLARVCRAEAPAVCLLTDFPNARPSGP